MHAMTARFPAARRFCRKRGYSSTVPWSTLAQPDGGRYPRAIAPSHVTSVLREHSISVQDIALGNGAGGWVYGGMHSETHELLAVSTAATACSPTAIQRALAGQRAEGGLHRRPPCSHGMGRGASLPAPQTMQPQWVVSPQVAHHLAAADAAHVLPFKLAVVHGGSVIVVTSRAGPNLFDAVRRVRTLSNEHLRELYAVVGTEVCPWPQHGRQP